MKMFIVWLNCIFVLSVGVLYIHDIKLGLAKVASRLSIRTIVFMNMHTAHSKELLVTGVYVRIYVHIMYSVYYVPTLNILG